MEPSSHFSELSTVFDLTIRKKFSTMFWKFSVRMIFLGGCRVVTFKA